MYDMKKQNSMSREDTQQKNILGENTYSDISVIIPAYKPQNAFLEFIKSLADFFDRIIIVDDGSGKEYRDLFDKAEKNKNIIVFRHAVNLGKGRSLKDGFNYVLDQYPDSCGVITADADGQHLIDDIRRVADVLRENPDKLVLGCRNFGKDDIPWKSRFGNNLTRKIFAFLCGIHVSDTQTGLRGIPLETLKVLMNSPGERYEYETNMLLECNTNNIGMIEVPITTVYESKKDHQTHFNPLRDSVAIYKVILIYSLSSILTALIDMVVFVAATWQGCGIWEATAVARIFAAFANFLLNKKVVFKADGNGFKQLGKYILLLITSGTVSAFAVSSLRRIIPYPAPTVWKIVEYEYA